MNIIAEQRYERNTPTISPEEQQRLSKKTVAVVGCGGLGGFVIEYLSRLGAGRIVAIDGDVFEPSNLNRQLLSTSACLGKSKALRAKERVSEINPDVECIAEEGFLTEENAAELLGGCNLIIDALDNVAARFVLEDAAEKLGLTIVHGAVQGWNAQVMVIPPGKKLMHSLYKNSAETGDEKVRKSCLVMTPACCASVQVSEALKYLLCRPVTLESRLMMMNLQTMETMVIDME